MSGSRIHGLHLIPARHPRAVRTIARIVATCVHATLAMVAAGSVSHAQEVSNAPGPDPRLLSSETRHAYTTPFSAEIARVNRGVAAAVDPRISPPRAAGGNSASWWAPVASLVLPGAGQALLRQQRSLAYVVAEAFMIIQSTRAQKDFDDARNRYRAIAADVARRQFGTDRPVGPWEYYEEMADATITSSGNYDLAVGGKFTPESDETTFNGRQWLIARSLYWTSPDVMPAEASAEYRNALDFYKARAVRDSFRWTWRDNQNAKELYVQTISEANHSKQQRVSVVGLLAANHLLSLVDAYVTVRVRRYGGAGLATASIRSELRPSGVPGDNSVASAVRFSMPIPGSGRQR